MSDPVIRASEIPEYVFCRRAWWLRRVAGRSGRNVQQLTAGTAFHEAHGRIVDQARKTRMMAYVLVALAVAVIVYGILQAV